MKKLQDPAEKARAQKVLEKMYEDKFEAELDVLPSTATNAKRKYYVTQSKSFIVATS